MKFSYRFRLVSLKKIVIFFAPTVSKKTTMSWFKDALEKVKEKGAAVKGIAKEVSHKAKEVRSRLIGSATASEIQTQLESRAGSILSLLELVDVLRGWSANLASDGPKYADVDRQVTFAHILLRSKTIEELLASLVCRSDLRMELCGAWPEVASLEETSSSMTDGQLAAFHLYQFLSKTLQGEKNNWTEIVGLLLAPHGKDEEVDIAESSSCESWLSVCESRNFRFLELSLIASLKRDWYADFLEKERRELGSNVDLKRTQLLQTSDQVWTRIKLSDELVALYESVRDNLDDSTLHRAGSRKTFLSSLASLEQAADNQKSLAKTEKENAKNRQLEVKSKMETTECEFKPRLEAILDERTAIDFKIANLEDHKKRLKLELEKVSQELVEAQTAQRDVMDYEQVVRADLVSTRNKLSDMLAKESSEETACDLNETLNLKLIDIIKKISENSEVGFQNSTSAIGDVHAQVESAFVEAIQDHMQILGEAIQELFRKSKRLADELESVKRTRNAQSMSAMLGSGQNGNETEEFSATLDRLELKASDLMDRLAAQSDELAMFSETFQAFLKRFDNKITNNRLLGGEVDKIQFVFAETEKVLKKYAPQVPVVTAKPTELLVEEIPESPRSQSS